jgi:uncharacterized protein (DUF58 family)
MIKSHSYPLLIVLALGVVESLLLAYNYFTVIMLALFFTVTSDILIFSFFESPAAEKLELTRKIQSSKLVKGGRTTVTVTLKNNSITTIHLNCEDMISETLVSANNSGFLTIRGGGTAELKYEVAAPFCGKQQFGPLRASLRDPFNFCSRDIELNTLSEIHVEPFFSNIENSRRETSRRMRQPSGTKQIVRAGQGYQFFRIRQYTDRDDPRSIVWNRYGTPQEDDIYVKEMQEERTREIVFLIDFSAGTVFGNTGRRIYDDIVSAVLKSTDIITQLGDRVGFLFYSSTCCHYIPAGKPVTTGMHARNFVSLNSPGGRFLLSSGIREAKRRMRKSAAVIVVSPMLDGEKFDPDVGYLLSGGSVSAVLVKAGDYVSRNSSDLKTILVRGVAIRKEKDIMRISRFLALSGMRTIVSTGNELPAKVIAAWAYGRMINAGS